MTQKGKVELFVLNRGLILKFYSCPNDSMIWSSSFLHICINIDIEAFKIIILKYYIKHSYIWPTEDKQISSLFFKFLP